MKWTDGYIVFAEVIIELSCPINCLLDEDLVKAIVLTVVIGSAASYRKFLIILQYNHSLSAAQRQLLDRKLLPPERRRAPASGEMIQ